MKVEAKDLANGIEIKLIFSKEECDILQSDLNGRQGIIDWYATGPSQQKIIHAAKKLGVEKKQDPVAMRALAQLPEAKYIECLSDHVKMAQELIKHPTYKDRNKKLQEEQLKEISKAQENFEEAKKLSENKPSKENLEKQAVALSWLNEHKKQLEDLKKMR